MYTYLVELCATAASSGLGFTSGHSQFLFTEEPLRMPVNDGSSKDPHIGSLSLQSERWMSEHDNGSCSSIAQVCGIQYAPSFCVFCVCLHGSHEFPLQERLLQQFLPHRQHRWNGTPANSGASYFFGGYSSPPKNRTHSPVRSRSSSRSAVPLSPTSSVKSGPASSIARPSSRPHLHGAMLAIADGSSCNVLSAFANTDQSSHRLACMPHDRPRGLDSPGLCDEKLSIPNQVQISEAKMIEDAVSASQIAREKLENKRKIAERWRRAVSTLHNQSENIELGEWLLVTALSTSNLASLGSFLLKVLYFSASRFACSTTATFYYAYCRRFTQYSTYYIGS
jgi:hypothetical protein